MLLPRFSLRTTLWVLTGASLFFVVAGYAVRGAAWAVGVTVAGVSVATALVTYAGVYLLVAAFGRLVGAETVVAKTSRGALVRDSPAHLGADRTPRPDGHKEAPSSS